MNFLMNLLCFAIPIFGGGVLGGLLGFSNESTIFMIFLICILIKLDDINQKLEHIKERS